jgi:hypothetical protein
VEQVSGSLIVRQVDASLEVQMLRGNAGVREVEGPVALGQVHGRLTAEGLRGGLDAERVMGNGRLGPPFSPGLTYRLISDGNLTVHLPEDTGLQLALRAAGPVCSHVPGLVLEDVHGQTKGSLADGEAFLEAQAGGWISLRPTGAGEKADDEPAFEFAGDIESLGIQIEARVARAIADMEARLAENLGCIDSDEVGRWAAEKAERARRAADREAERARRAVEQEAERARLRAERAERRWRRASGRRTRPRRAQATDEERMRVLRLVKPGKITPEQAADLLAALDGR